MSELTPGRATRPVRKQLLLIVAMLAATVVLLAWGCSSRASRSAGDPDRLRFEAVAACESLVEGRLRSPATAGFDSSARGGGVSWRVTGVVDSENGFGALVRTSFACDVTVGGGRVRAVITELG